MKKPIEDFVECIESLNVACNSAGGSAPGLPDLKKMSALELIDMICSNEIQFTYLGDRKDHE